jgi:transcriptional regulator with XRE-family HTH domain
MHCACQARCACHAVVAVEAIGEDGVMAPVKKSIQHRGPTFIRAWRDYRGLSQEEAAERVDVDRTTISRLESGKIPYNQDILERLALAYGCDVEDLIRVDPLKPDPPRLVYQQLLRASPTLQRQALAVIEAMIKDDRAA